MAVERPESEVEEEEGLDGRLFPNTATLKLTAQQETRAAVRHGYIVSGA